MIPLVITACIVTSHTAYALPLIRAMRRREIPSTLDFVALSLFLFFDVGIVCEAAGVPYSGTHFRPFFSAPPDDLLVAVPLLWVAPWIIRSWSITARQSVARLPQLQATELAPSRRAYFYLVAVVICGCILAISLYIVDRTSNVWQTRLIIGEALGPFVIILYLPMYILAFYVRQRDVRSLGGGAFALFLALTSVIATLPVGERTLVLLPFVICVLFIRRLSLRTAIACAFLGVAAASLVLPLFKFQHHSETDMGILVSATVAADLARAPVLVGVLQNSATIGTIIMNYPGAGYVYSALFFMPRSLVPFKGGSTAQSFTARLDGTLPEDTHWGVGISAIDEIALNFGVLLVIPGLIVLGMVIGWLDKASVMMPSLVVPVRLAAVWCMGYHLPALLLLFGAMAAVCLLLQRSFACRVPPPFLKAEG